MITAVAAAAQAAYGARPRPLAPRASEDERARHAAFIRDAVKNDELWKKFGL
jgi:DNA polymerase-3 subunit epsilon